MGRVSVSSNKPVNSDVFTLTNISNNQSVALIPSDSAGNFNWSGIRRAPLERNAMQTTTSSGEWSDLEYPWMAIQQEDWTGGRGNDRFTSDKSRFYDSKRCQSAFNSVIFNGPLDHYSEDIKDSVTNYPASTMTWVDMLGDYRYFYQQLELTSAHSVGEIYLQVKRTGNPGSIKVTLQNSVGTSPTVYSTSYIYASNLTDITSEFYKVTFTNVSLTGVVCLVLTVQSSDDNQDHWSIGVTSGNSGFISTNGSTWTRANKDIIYRLQPSTISNVGMKFFTYQSMLYMVRHVGTTPTLWINGDIGEASTGSSTTLVNRNKNWTVNMWAGAQIGIVYGKGSDALLSNLRTITSNTANTITISGTWSVIPAANTTYVIVNTPHWTQITGHGLTTFVSDICVARNMVFFCQGSTNIVRMSRASNAYSFSSWSGQSADYLQVIRSTQGLMLWRGRNNDEYGNRSVQRAQFYDFPTTDTTICTTADSSKIGTGTLTHIDYDIVEYALTVSGIETDKYATILLQESADGNAYETIGTLSNVDCNGTYYLTAKCKYTAVRTYVSTYTGTANAVSVVLKKMSTPHWTDYFPLQDNYGKITRLFEYGSDSAKSLWVFQEGMVSSVTYSGTAYNLDRINIDELQTTSDEFNGMAVATSDVYLLFGWLNGVQRYYNTQMEGKGPDKDEGLPINRRGRISQILSYPSNWFVSVDAGSNGFSSVLMFNQSGWHEIYRAPNKGERILDIAFQPIHGSEIDRLWMQVGDNAVWLSMPSKTLYALHDTKAEYIHESVLVSSWITGGMAEVDKLWQGISIMSENLDGTNCWVEVDYQVDDEDEWHTVANHFVTSPSQEEEFSEYSVNGKKLRYRLRLQTTDMSITPKINAVLIKAIGRVDVKHSYSFYFRNIKYKSDLMGEYEDIEPYDLQCLLDEWANKLYKLRLNSAYKIFDDKIVFLDAVETSVLNELSEGYLGQITLTEV